MRRVVAKRIRKEVAKAFPGGSNLSRRQDGSKYWTGRKREYINRKKMYKARLKT